MRLLLDTLIALMLVAVLAGVLWHDREQRMQAQREQTVRTALNELHDALLYRAAVRDARLTNQGFPIAISPSWFTDAGLPMNLLVPGRQPWMDMAPAGDMADHPPDPVIVRSEQAGFWYNPQRGIVRARVLPQLSNRATLDLYNKINSVHLAQMPSARQGGQRPMEMPILADLRFELEQTQAHTAAAKVSQTLRHRPARRSAALD